MRRSPLSEAWREVIPSLRSIAFAVAALAVAACSSGSNPPENLGGSGGNAGPGGSAGASSSGDVSPEGNGGATAPSGGAAASSRGTTISTGGAAAGAGGTAPSGGAGSGGASGGTGSGDANEPASCLGRPMPPRAYARFDPPATLASYFPTSAFQTATPEAAGMDAAKLALALAHAPAHSRTQGIVVFRNGHIVGERYVPPFTQQTRHESYSVAKGFSSALLGIAIRDGLIAGVDTPICGSYPEWGCDPGNRRSRITVAHAVNVATGIEWTEDWRIGATGTNDAYTPSILDLALARPVADEPGTRQRYSTGDPALLSGVLQKAAGKTAFEYAKTALLGPIGLTSITWGSDSKGRTTTHMGISATTRDLGKFGLLYLNRGNWNGTQVVPADWVDFTTRAVDPCKDQYRYLWHVNLTLRLGEAQTNCSGFLECDPATFADVPASAYLALGVYGQMIAVLPSAGIVIARVGQDDAGSEYWDGYARDVIRLVLDAVK